ncbi:MAG: hypothetical protein QM401_04925 [Bacillota bacterium]|nr:hypothetical protein [Bacillota bacterium]
MSKQNLLKLSVLLLALALTLTLTGCLGGSLGNSKDQTIQEFLEEVTTTYRSKDLNEIERLFYFATKEDSKRQSYHT